MVKISREKRFLSHGAVAEVWHTIHFRNEGEKEIETHKKANLCTKMLKGKSYD
jgi:hypothetical protein